jgi:rubrerythrin
VVSFQAIFVSATEDRKLVGCYYYDGTITEEFMADEKGQERTDKLVKTLRQWQGIERNAIETCSKIMEKSDNALIRQFMEIIRNDSVQHHRVQQFIIDSLTKQPISLSHEDLAKVWEEIEAHDEVERRTIEMAKECKEECRFFVQRALLTYLISDEEKHDLILKELDNFKRNMSKLG